MATKNVSLEKAAGRENELIIKDGSGITVGRVFIIEMIEENRYCTLRIKFYRQDSYMLFKDALTMLLRKLFKNNDINKANILVDELLDIRAFSDLGFKLEGIIEDCIYNNGKYRSELSFGINSLEFENLQRTSIFKLIGENIELRILTPENSEDMFAYSIRNREYLSEFEPTREESYYTEEAQRKILIEEYKQYLNGSAINCGIFKANKLIGKVRLSNIVYGVFRSAFLGYSIDKDEQGKGYMKEAVKLITDYAFDDMELHRIEASTLVDNLKSQKVLIGCGFSELGINKSYLFINGVWRDHITFYKLKK
jgi:ribosomal-protein-alanine N-acetyltransferase